MSEPEYIEETLAARLYDSSAPLVMAVDGRCASGKTTLAARLGERFDAPVFHTDDFYLPFARRDARRMEKPGGHMDCERLAREVLERAFAGQELLYRPYDAHADAWGPELKVPPRKLYIVEGAYAFLPELESYYGYKIFLTHDAQAQRTRLLAREGEAKLKAFLEKWIPAEERYFAQCEARERADAAFDTSGWW